jgi:hypothetical protein
VTARDEPGLALPGDRAAEGPSPGVQVGLAQHQVADPPGQQRGGGHGDRAAHAVPEQVEAVERQALDQPGDGAGVVLDRVAEARRPVAEAEAEQVEQQHAAAGERVLGRAARVVAR